MIVSGLKTEKVLVEINSIDVIEQLKNEYIESKVKIKGAYIEDGIWKVYHERGNHYSEEKDLRKATEEEIEYMNNFSIFLSMIKKIKGVN